MKMRARAISMTLACVLVLGVAAPAAARSTDRGAADGGIVKILTRVYVSSSGVVVPATDVSLAAAGQWNAGCQMSGYDGGTLVYRYTLWQYFASNGISITRPVAPPTFTSWSSYGWLLTSAPPPSQWWVIQYTRLMDQGSFTFTQYIVKQSSGWVQITVNGNGTWTCNGQ